MSVAREAFPNGALKRGLHLARGVGDFEHANPRQSQDAIFVHDVAVSRRDLAGFSGHLTVWALNFRVSVSPIVPRLPIQSVNQVALDKMPEHLVVGDLFLLLKKTPNHLSVLVIGAGVLRK